ncbi:hypothetical protein PoB_002163500 [Plakobranchus ocellatus]|uniref:Uncharacterized protein n=1 Tax=Plakobranchus ocellatus TaxID=259542 RepID=A0AAV3ZJ26_9GAST|nr:hypothetical protein PoB_002163500 [Plakobranchus ocellatus]
MFSVLENIPISFPWMWAAGSSPAQSWSTIHVFMDRGNRVRHSRVQIHYAYSLKLCFLPLFVLFCGDTTEDFIAMSTMAKPSSLALNADNLSRLSLEIMKFNSPERLFISMSATAKPSNLAVKADNLSLRRVVLELCG